MNRKMTDFLSTKCKPKIKVVLKPPSFVKESVSEDSEHNILTLRDGKIVIDESEYYIKKSRLRGPVIEENEDLPATSLTYAIKKGGKRWSIDETHLFYKALEICGTEFSLLSEVFVNRSRKEIKNKYKKELKMNQNRVNQIVKEWKGFDQMKYEELKENE